MAALLKDASFWIALWGGITGTIALAFTWLSFKQDCAKLCAEARLSLMRDNVEKPAEWRLEVALRNQGRRPCYVDKIGLAVPAKSLSFGGHEMPVVGPVVFNLYDSMKSGAIALEESQRRSILTPIPEAFLQMLHSSSGSEGILIIIDSLGREVRCTFRLPDKEHIVLRQDDAQNQG